jgi:hypothetical protein
MLEQAEKLVSTIRDLLEQSNADRKRVDEARAYAEETHRRFNESVERARERQAPGERPTIDGIGQSLIPPGMPANSRDLRESVHRSIKRETAICDAFDTLIVLAAAPDLAIPVAKVAAVLREYRIYQVAFQLDELEDTALPDFAPAPAEAMHDEMARNRWKMDMAARVSGWTRDRMERSRSRHDRALDELQRLLRTAVEQAEQLLDAARGMA